MTRLGGIGDIPVNFIATYFSNYFTFYEMVYMYKLCLEPSVW